MAARTRIYLDHNAGAVMRPQVAGCVRDLIGVAGNASSVHAEGRAARARIEEARAQIAALAGVTPAQVAFTSGATEANVTALSPVWRKGRGEVGFSRLLVAASEHASVLSGGRFARDRVETVPVDGEGVIDLAALEARLAGLSAAGETILVSVMAANNETGVLQPLAEVGRIVAAAGAVLHVDAVQAAGRLFIDMEGWGAASLSLSAHKIGGPQGAGALVTRQPGVKPVPLLVGGGQEHWDRAGTENVAALAGFGVAARLAATELGDWGKIAALRDGLEQEVRHISGDAIVFSSGAARLANTSCLAVPGVAAETALIALDLEGIAVSSGSACSSGKVGVSHVLSAMGVEEKTARCALRVSLQPATTQADIDGFLAALRRISDRVLGTSGAGRAA